MCGNCEVRNLLDIWLLGCGGSMPVPNRSLTSLLVSFKGSKVLIDCGEGTQVSMKMVGTGFKAIDAICFTHYHADHVAGLPGLLLTIANSGRVEPLTIIGPPGLKKIITGLMVIAPVLPYDINLIEIDQDAAQIKIGNMMISTISVQHTIPCLAYSIDVKRQRRFDVNKASENNVPRKLWSGLQNGDKINFEGKIYNSDMVLAEERKGIKICYATDTRPIDKLVDFIKGAEIFICEGMYGDNDEIVKAQEYNHMLFSEAAGLARKGNVKELWLTHFSPSLSEPEKYLLNAKDIFENTKIGEDRMCKTINFQVD